MHIGYVSGVYRSSIGYVSDTGIMDRDRLQIGCISGAYRGHIGDGDRRRHRHG